MKTSKDRILTIDNEAIKSLREIAVEKIREAIVSGHFKPGDHLRERELSEIMGISTTPIKEAYRILENEGLLVTIPRKGTYVSDFADTSVEEIFLLRASVEGLCAKLATLKMTDEDMDQLEKQINLMQELMEKNDTERLVVENTNFHKMIINLARNPMIEKILGTIAAFDTAFRRRALKLDVEVQEGYAEHKQIFEAIKARDADLAEQRIKNHILRTTQNVLQNKA